MSKERNICTVRGCVNEGRYCRLHLNYSIPQVAEVNKKSDKQKKVEAKYKKVRKKFLEEHPVCLAALQGCTKQATEVHHMAGKANEELYLDTQLFLPVCHNCHVIVEKHPAFAKQNGLSVSRHSKKVSSRA